MLQCNSASMLHPQGYPPTSLQHRYKLLRIYPLNRVLRIYPLHNPSNLSSFLYTPSPGSSTIQTKATFVTVAVASLCVLLESPKNASAYQGLENGGGGNDKDKLASTCWQLIATAAPQQQLPVQARRSRRTFKTSLSLLRHLSFSLSRATPLLHAITTLHHTPIRNEKKKSMRLPCCM